MATRLNVVLALGTRPEIVKLAPVARALRSRGARVTICLTGQHLDLARPFLRLFPVRARYALNVMRAEQPLARLTSQLFRRLDDVIVAEHPAAVVVQGDTSSAFVAAVTAFYRHIPVAHVEAGLRSGTLAEPFPEEMNRRFISTVATYHYAPTKAARRHLLAAGIAPSRIVVTGNTVIDAVRELVPATSLTRGTRRYIVVTAHRRENVGAPLDEICDAVSTIVLRHRDVRIIWPVHPNPAVRRQVFAHLATTERVDLVDPLPYERFLQLLARSTLVLTDSGGIQEEVTALGRPVLILRRITERPEVTEAGNGLLVGTDARRIVREVDLLLTDGPSYARRARVSTVFGDGHAGERIARHLVAALRSSY